jgi:ABC-type glycerol-3-phosphate transport system permease component
MVHPLPGADVTGRNLVSEISYRPKINWRRLQRFAGHVFPYLVIIVLMSWVLFPFYWMATSSVKLQTELFDFPPTWWPSVLTFENYQWALTNPRFLGPLLNSTIVAFLTVALATPIAAVGAYALARFSMPKKRGMMGALVATQMIPGVLIVIPLFVVFTRLGLVNTYFGLALGYATFTLPYAIIQLRAFFANFPVELEEAAIIDGCTWFGAFWRITLPLSIPGVVAVALFSIVIAWNDLLFAMILTGDIKSMTVAVQLYNMSTSQFASTNWGGILAEATIITLPVVFIFVFMQSYLVQGLTAGAVKG